MNNYKKILASSEQLSMFRKLIFHPDFITIDQSMENGIFDLVEYNKDKKGNVVIKQIKLKKDTIYKYYDRYYRAYRPGIIDALPNLDYMMEIKFGDLYHSDDEFDIPEIIENENDTGSYVALRDLSWTYNKFPMVYNNSNIDPNSRDYTGGIEFIDEVIDFKQYSILSSERVEKGTRKVLKNVCTETKRKRKILWVAWLVPIFWIPGIILELTNGDSYDVVKTCKEEEVDEPWERTIIDYYIIDSNGNRWVDDTGVEYTTTNIEEAKAKLATLNVNENNVTPEILPRIFSDVNDEMERIISHDSMTVPVNAYRELYNYTDLVDVGEHGTHHEYDILKTANTYEEFLKAGER